MRQMTRQTQQRTEQGALAANAPWYDYDAQVWMRGDQPAPPAPPAVVTECWTCWPAGMVVRGDDIEYHRALGHDVRPVKS